MMQAAMVVSWYVQNMDDPLARKVEAVLASLGRQTRYESQRDKAESKITDFFSRS